MKLESHLESYREHRETIFDWAIKVKGLKDSRRTIGTHASRAIVDLFAVYLLKRNLIDSGVQLNHRWFKSKKVMERFPEFDGKEEIILKMIELELICEDLTYGTPKPESVIKEAVEIFRELEDRLK
jgi:hypothetical protein